MISNPITCAVCRISIYDSAFLKDEFQGMIQPKYWWVDKDTNQIMHYYCSAEQSTLWYEKRRKLLNNEQQS